MSSASAAGSRTEDDRRSQAATEGQRSSGGGRSLSAEEKRVLLWLGLPTFGLALSITAVSTYLPLLARQFTGSATIIGLIIGGEGIMALFLPLLAGSWSDSLRTRVGGRLPFVLAGAPLAAGALVIMGFVGSLGAVALVVALFFAAYFVTYEPYRALYPDLVADDVAGRAQSTQALWRGSGTGLALLGGGLLFSLWRPLPFIAAATILLAAVGTFTVVRLRHRRVSQSERREPRSAPAGVGAVGREALGSLRRALREHPALRAFVAANALWELSLGALKTFVVLYLTAGLGYSVGTSSLIVGAVAVVILAAAAVSGRLGDRFGRGRVMHVALWAYAAGLLVPFVITTPGLIVPFVPLIAFGGGVIMTLPYALLMPMMPEREHGALTGIYSMSRGVGTVLGPLFAGVAIDALKRPLSGTEGYQAMWLVCSLGIVLSIPLLRSLRSHARDRERLQRA